MGAVPPPWHASPSLSQLLEAPQVFRGLGQALSPWGAQPCLILEILHNWGSRPITSAPWGENGSPCQADATLQRPRHTGDKPGARTDQDTCRESQGWVGGWVGVGMCRAPCGGTPGFPTPPLLSDHWLFLWPLHRGHVLSLQGAWSAERPWALAHCCPLLAVGA